MWYDCEQEDVSYCRSSEGKTLALLVQVLRQLFTSQNREPIQLSTSSEVSQSIQPLETHNRSDSTKSNNSLDSCAWMFFLVSLNCSALQKLDLTGFDPLAFALGRRELPYVVKDISTGHPNGAPPRQMAHIFYGRHFFGTPFFRHPTNHRQSPFFYRPPNTLQ